MSPADRVNITMGATLDLVGRYSISDDLELSGDPLSFQHLADILVLNEIAVRVLLHVPSNSTPDAYDGFLTTLEIAKDDGLVRIKRFETHLSILGSNEKLALLAANNGRTVIGMRWYRKMARVEDPTRSGCERLVGVEYMSTLGGHA